MNLNSALHRLLLLGLISLGLIPNSAAGDEPGPLEVLQQHVAAGVKTLAERPAAGTEAHAQQQAQLCEIANDMFDIYAFSRLVLAARWQQFSSDEQAEFVAVFGEFLCRYYISRLQARYSNEQVRFVQQTMKSERRAVVRAEVTWNDIDVPVDIKMARRQGQWRAFDISVAGISAVMLYRSQFEDALQTASPAKLIDELRLRMLSASQ